MKVMTDNLVRDFILFMAILAYITIWGIVANQGYTMQFHYPL